MLPPKVIIRFFLVVAAIAAVLLTRWPGVQEGYAACFRWGNNVIFARYWFWSEATVGFLDPNDLSTAAKLSPEARAMVPPAVGVRDTVMVLENRRVPGAVGFLRTSSRYLGYVPAAVLIRLITSLIVVAVETSMFSKVPSLRSIVKSVPVIVCTPRPSFRSARFV